MLSFTFILFDFRRGGATAFLRVNGFGLYFKRCVNLVYLVCGFTAFADDDLLMMIIAYSYDITPIIVGIFFLVDGGWY